MSAIDPCGVLAAGNVHCRSARSSGTFPTRTPSAAAIGYLDGRGDLFRAIAHAAKDRSPDAKVTPLMSTGGTDRPHFRSFGIVTWGFGPFLVADGDGRGVHGNDEQVSVSNVMACASCST